MDISAEIDRLSRHRQGLWSSGSDPAEIDRIAARLADLYELRRAERARVSAHGGRDEILRRARVESELERMIAAR